MLTSQCTRRRNHFDKKTSIGLICLSSRTVRGQKGSGQEKEIMRHVLVSIRSTAHHLRRRVTIDPGGTNLFCVHLSIL